MIGQLINKFDALPEEKCNVGTFNKMFGNLLSDDKNTSIEIGGIITGGRREILVDNKLRIIELRDIKEPTEKASLYNFEYRYEIDLAGETIKFDTIKEMGESLAFSANWLSQKFGKSDSNEIEHKGHLIRKIVTKKTIKKCMIKKEKVVKTKVSRTFCSLKGHYTLTTPEGVSISYTNVYDVIKFFKTSHKTLFLKLKEDRSGTFRGHKIKHTKFTKEEKARITQLMKKGLN